MDNRLLFIALIVSIIFISIVSADVNTQVFGTFKQSSTVNLIINCGNSTYANISQIVIPDTNIILGDFVMSKSSANYNYTFTNTSEIGQYLVYIHCDFNGADTVDAYSLNINPTGQPFNTSEAIIYAIVMVLSIILLVGFVSGGLMISSKNSSDQMTGYIIAVDNKKYLKLGCWCASYLLALLILWFGYQISYAFLNLPFLSQIFDVAFYIMAILLIPLFPIFVFIIIANKVKDSKVHEALMGGLRIRE